MRHGRDNRLCRKLNWFWRTPRCIRLFALGLGKRSAWRCHLSRHETSLARDEGGKNGSNQYHVTDFAHIGNLLQNGD